MSRLVTTCVVLALVAAACGSDGVAGVGIDGSASNVVRVATLTDGFLHEDLYNAELLGDRPTVALTAEDGESALAAMIAAGVEDPSLPEIDYSESFLLLAIWDACRFDRAYVMGRGNHLWVEGEEQGVDCDAPTPAVSPVAIGRGEVGPVFSHDSYDDPASVITFVTGETASTVSRVQPIATRAGRDGIEATPPDEPEIAMALTAEEVDALLTDPRFPDELHDPEAAPIDSSTDRLVMVSISACRQHMSLGFIDDQVRVLAAEREWEGCELRTASAVFSIDDLPPLPLALGFDSFAEEAMIDIG